MSIPKICRAVVLPDYNQPYEIQDIAIPEIKGDEILVKVHLAGICGTDLHQKDGSIALPFKPPFIPGHETIGHIVALGPDRKHDVAGAPLQEGDRIMWAHRFCGECYYCAVMRMPFMCNRNIGYGFSHPKELMGGFAEYVRVMNRTEVVKVPDNLTDEEAIGVGCAMRSVMSGFVKLQATKPLLLGDTVVVQGSGPIGMYALLCAVCSGAGKVIVVGGPQGRLDMAKKWGAAETIDIFTVTDHAERVKLVMEMTGGRGAELAIECSGFPPAFEQGFSFLDRGSTYLVLGQTTPKKIEFAPFNILGKNVTVIGSGSADIVHFYRALKFLSAIRDKYPVGLMVTAKYKLEQADEAVDSMIEGKDMKAVFDLR
ncbi:MAG: zinc-binding dehydrogenase [Gracilibacteraceae bacterium]|jgi:threonine dehydrogenase-like Zn-dependent dehydrogenase|nr:zinc-binding dehydrogenase [Gracilibacteraceae bacterium]